MKILFASSELHPFSITGQLAEFSRLLPAALARRGHEIIIFTPRYKSVDPKDLRRKRCRLNLIIKGKPVQGSIAEGATPEGVPVFFVEQPGYFERESINGTSQAGFEDDDERYSFFCRSVLESCRLLDIQPDIIHCNDWQTGPIPALLQFEYRDRPELNSSGTVFTIHDLSRQGLFPPESMLSLGLKWDLFTPSSFEFDGKVSLVKGGLVFADKLTTISQRHAEEIKTPAFSYGLEKHFIERSAELRGIPGGIDTSYWDPQNDKCLARQYSPDNLEGKSICKSDLQNRLGFKQNQDRMLIAVLCEFTTRCGVDLFLKIAQDFLKLPCQWIFCGRGDPRIQEALEQLMLTHPEQLIVQPSQSEELTRQILAGSDLLFLPYRSEPCGYNHLLGLRYGTIPLVHEVGSLEDTIDDVSEPEGNGFKFSDTNPTQIIDTLRRALTCYSDHERWRQLISYAMNQDHSWDLPSRRYEVIYREVKALRS